MPRPQRVHVPGALYYVTSRALEQVPLFRDRRDYETYLEFLGAYRTQFGFRLFAFALMPDQITLCLELPSQTTLSTIMHALNSRYTKYVAKRYGRTGHIFQERFRATVVEKTPNLLRLTGYVHALPQRTRAATEFSAFHWTSYGQYQAAETAGRGVCSLEAVAEVLGRLSGMSYAQFLSSIPESEWERLDLELAGQVVGSTEFMHLVRRLATKPARPASAGPSPQPQPRPAGPRATRQGTPSAVFAGSLAVAVVSLALAGLFARNLASVRHAIRAMASELEMRSAAPMGVSQTTLASFEAVGPGSPTGLIRSFNLNGTTWDLRLAPLASAGQPVSVQSDRLRFERNLVLSSRLSRQGVMPSAYTLRFRPDGAPVWEATQEGRSGDVISWRGEWDGQRMRGVMTQQGPGRAAVTFSFVATVQEAQAKSGQEI